MRAERTEAPPGGACGACAGLMGGGPSPGEVRYDRHGAAVALVLGFSRHRVEAER
ncbi:hypothetical protein ACIQJT_38010 [Streptomyces sp. NPDC091972]|uniref:hypothetical protein n=1 Tax=Streptomyces sp. NPDC091972 TaxID=3366007 RepID=UPI00382F1848